MSNNTNTLFWIITGAVIVLLIFGLTKSNINTVTSANDEIGSLFSKVNADPNLLKYYGHEKNYNTLTITDESLFEFDATTGTIKRYYGSDTNIVIPYSINGVEVKKIGNLDLWNRHLYYEECESLLYFVPETEEDEMFYEMQKQMLEYEGIWKGDSCQISVLLDSVVIPNTVEELGDCSFCYNQNITNVNLPKSLKRIGAQAFYENNLESIKLDHLNKLTEIGESAFGNNQITGNLIIPDNVTDMSSNVFRNNNLSSVVLSKNLKTLHSGNFYGSFNLESVTFRNSEMEVPVSKYIFDGFSNLTIYVPRGSLERYSNISSLSGQNLVEFDL